MATMKKYAAETAHAARSPKPRQKSNSHAPYRLNFVEPVSGSAKTAKATRPTNSRRSERCSGRAFEKALKPEPTKRARLERIARAQLSIAHMSPPTDCSHGLARFREHRPSLASKHLLDPVRERIRSLHYSLRTDKACLDWERHCVSRPQFITHICHTL